jgi:hypothetical protein
MVVNDQNCDEIRHGLKIQERRASLGSAFSCRAMLAFQTPPLF